MLVTKSFKEGDVVTIKLSCGDEVVAKLTNIALNSYTVSNPLRLVPQQMGQGKVSLGFLPLLLSGEPNAIELFHSGLAAIAISAEDMRMSYLEATGGLVTPKSRLIV